MKPRGSPTSAGHSTPGNLTRSTPPPGSATTTSFSTPYYSDSTPKLKVLGRHPTVEGEPHTAMNNGRCTPGPPPLTPLLIVNPLPQPVDRSFRHCRCHIPSLPFAWMCSSEGRQRTTERDSSPTTSPRSASAGHHLGCLETATRVATSHAGARVSNSTARPQTRRPTTVPAPAPAADQRPNGRQRSGPLPPNNRLEPPHPR